MKKKLVVLDVKSDFILSNYPQPTVLPQCERPSFTPIQNNRQNYSSVCFNIYIFGYHKYHTRENIYPLYVTNHCQGNGLRAVTGTKHMASLQYVKAL